MAKEYIERGLLLSTLQTAQVDVMADYGRDYGAEWGFSREVIEEIAKTLPATDVVEVVRCKDCEYFEPEHGCGNTFWDTDMKYYDFCSRGERKDA